MQPSSRILLLCLFIAGSLRARAATEVKVHFEALQRIIAREVFTTEGRKYVRGTPQARCSFAYLENPKLQAENGYIVLRARFSGRSALDLFGKCVGLGDSFDVVIRALPAYREGALGFEDVRVESPGRDSFYIRRVRGSLARSLSRDFKYSLVAEAKKVLESVPEKSPYRKELTNLNVSSIRVTPEAVILVVDFTLAVK